MTIAETLVVAVIIGLMLFAIAGAVPPLLSAPARAQAKTDSISPGASGLYIFERDLRESDPNAIFACTGWPAVCGPGIAGTGDTAVVVATALSSSDLGATFQTSQTGAAPAWQGFIVYWQRVPGGDLYRSFEAASIDPHLFDPDPQDRAALLQLVQTAEASAAAETQPAIAMHDIAEFSAAVNPATGVTSIHVVAAGKAGYEHNSTTFDDDVLAHN